MGLFNRRKAAGKINRKQERTLCLFCFPIYEIQIKERCHE